MSCPPEPLTSVSAGPRVSASSSTSRLLLPSSWPYHRAVPNGMTDLFVISTQTLISLVESFPPDTTLGHVLPESGTSYLFVGAMDEWFGKYDKSDVSTDIGEDGAVRVALWPRELCITPDFPLHRKLSRKFLRGAATAPVHVSKARLLQLLRKLSPDTIVGTWSWVAPAASLVRRIDARTLALRLASYREKAVNVVEPGKGLYLLSLRGNPRFVGVDESSPLFAHIRGEQHQ